LKPKLHANPKVITEDKKQSDSIISDFLKDKVEDALTKEVKETKPKQVV